MFSQRILLRRLVRVGVTLAFLALTLPAAAEKKWALLIGVNKPHLQTKGITPLEFPDDDVAALAKTLENDHGYDVIPLDRHRTKRQDILIELYELARKISPDDSVIVYFSGHGARNFNGRVYWITYDTDIAIMDHNGIRLDHLIEYVLDLDAKRKLVLLDHCYAGELEAAMDSANMSASAPPAVSAAPPAAPAPAPAAAVTTKNSSGNDQFEIRKKDAIPEDEYSGYVAPPLDAKGIVVLAASSNEALEIGGNVKHGVFTSVLLEALQTRKADTGNPPDGDLTVTELANYLMARVPVVARDAGGVMQRPRDHYRGEGIGNWVIGKLPATAAEAATRAQAMKNDLRRWVNSLWLCHDFRVLANDVIDKWVAAQAAKISLAGEDARLWRYVSAAFENSAIPEEKRARTLNDDVKNEGFLPQTSNTQPPCGAQ